MPGTKNSGGRNKKSDTMHLVTGTFRKHRHARQATLDPPKGTPTPPKLLRGDAKAEWNRMVARLEESGTLAVVDDAVLYQYAHLFAETEALQSDLAENRKLSTVLKKQVTRLDGSELVQAIKQIVELRYLVNKSTRDLRQQRMAIRQYLVELGQTPGSRTRVRGSGGATPTKSKLETFLDGKTAH